MNKKKIMLGALVILAALLYSAISVSAYHNPHGTLYVLDAKEGAYYQDFRYVDYFNRPIYRVYGPRNDFGSDDRNYYGSDNRHYYRGYGSRHYYDSDDFDEYIERQRAARFIGRSFNDRYRITAGESSANAFCSTCNEVSYWGNKPAYNHLDKSKENRDYYYRNSLGSDEQANWRF